MPLWQMNVKISRKKELVAVCIRYLHGGLVKERAIGFLDTCDMTASEKMLEVLAPLNLDPELCMGFCFDGACDVRCKRWSTAHP